MAVTYTGDVNFDPNGVPLQIGDTGIGSLLINGGSLESFNGPANGNGPFVQIGNQAGGTGTVTVTGMGSKLEFIGATYGSGMHIGNSGTGTLTVSNRALLDMRDQPGTTSFEAGFTVGRRNSGDGTLILDDATATISALYAYMEVGRDTATGTVDILNGASLTMDGSQQSYITVGRQAGGVGDFSIVGGSVVNLTMMETNATDTNGFMGVNFNVGQTGAQGTALINASTLSLISEHVAGITIAQGSLISNGAGGTMTDGTTGDLTVNNGATINIAAGASSSESAYINVGRSHGPGSMSVTDSTVSLSSVNEFSSALITVAIDGATGTLMIDNSLVELTSDEYRAGILIGDDFGGTASVASGSVEIKNDSTVNLTGDVAALMVGRHEGVTASLSVSDSQVNFLDTGSREDIATAFAVGALSGTSGNATATLDDSTFTGLEYVVIGSDTPEGLGDILNPGASGSGTLTFVNGSRIETGDMVVGEGGELVAGTATVSLFPLIGQFGGTFGVTTGELGVLPGGALDINGNIDISDGSDLTFGIDTSGLMGRIDQTGPPSVTFSTDYTNTLTIAAQGGHIFSSGDRHTIFTTTATNANRTDTLFDTSLPLPTGLGSDFTVTNQNADFGWMLLEDASGQIDFLALNNGNGAGTAIANFGSSDFSGAVDLRYDGNTGAATTTGGQSAIVGNVQRVFGSAQNDTLIVTGTGDIALIGGAGNDTLAVGSGDDTLNGGAGADSLNGGAGTDIVAYSGTTGLTVDLQNSGNNTGDAAGDTYAGIENLYGTSGIDNLRGDAGNNLIAAGGGEDVIFGRDGDDTLLGGNDDDVLLGGAGADSLNGGGGEDRAQYTDSSAGLRADLQASVVNTGIAAGDTYASVENIYGSNFGDDLRGDTGDNIVSGENGSDFMFGRDGDDTLLGGFGDDRMFGGAGADVLNGGSGNDRVVYTDSATGIRADLLNSAVNTGIAAGDTYINIESLYGSNHDDDLRGDNADSTLLGRAGEDTLYGRDGDDKLFAGADDDILVGGAGADLHNGGGGKDTATYIDSGIGLRADLLNSGVNTGIAAGDTYVFVENLSGSNFNDDLRGDNSDNIVAGRNGDDTLFGRNGDDTLQGGNGDDLLIGGNGADILTGGSGADSFRFNSTAEAIDIITDFTINTDTIELNDSGFASLSAGALAAGNFRIGAAAADGNDYVIYNSGTGALFYDADGNGSGSTQVQIATLDIGLALDQNDFLIV